MRRATAWSLALAACLSGCDVAMLVSSRAPAERVTASGVKGKAQAVQKLKPRAAQPEDGQDRGETSESTPATPSTDGDTATESVASEATGAGASEEATAERTTLKLVEAAGTAFSLIPLLADDGSVSALLFQSEKSSLSWKVEATRGPAALTVSKVKLTLTPRAWYPPPEDPFATEEAVASDAEASPEAEETIPPRVVEVLPADLGWAKSIAPGSSQTLTYETNAPAIRSFLTDYYGVSRFSLTLTLLDPAGEPLTDDSDDPIELDQSIQVL